MFCLLVSILLLFLTIMCAFFSLFLYYNRYSAFSKSLFSLINSILDSFPPKLLFFYLFVGLLVINLSGNIPLNSIPTLFYSETLTLSLLFWAPIMVCVYITQLKTFMAHMLPYGAPTSLMILLPLVEIFSQLIRPFTLMIRLSTNLSSGHIMMYMFSYFTLLSSFLSPFIYVVLYVLFILELCISLLQAYIFVSLLSLYLNETL